MSLPVDIEEKYEVLGRLGAGGMGEVYKVRHRLLDELRVVKVLRAQVAASVPLRTRFHREARAAIRLRHPHIAQVYDFSIDPRGTAFLVMEYIDGLSLKELLDQGPPPCVGAAVEIACQSLEALGYLHERGYLHRDISPGNLMLTRGRDGGSLAKLIDLGLAKELTGSSDLTATGMFVGTVRYASPERFRRTAGEADARSDLYSFGAVLYELLTGTCPIEGSSFEELVSAHLLEPALGFERSDPQRRLPPALRQVLLDSLEKDPRQRIPSAEAFAQRLLPFREPAAARFDDVVRGRDGLSKDRRGDPRPAEGSDGDRTEAVVPVTLRASRWLPAVSRDQPSARRKLGASALLLGLLAAGLLWWWIRDPPPALPSQGRGMIEAAPWAEVTAIVDAGGGTVPLQGPVFTPVSLSLPTGSYAVTLAHPDLEAPRVEALEVRSGSTSRLEVELGGIGVDGYFEAAGLAAELRGAGS